MLNNKINNQTNVLYVSVVCLVVFFLLHLLMWPAEFGTDLCNSLPAKVCGSSGLKFGVSVGDVDGIAPPTSLASPACLHMVPFGLLIC